MARRRRRAGSRAGARRGGQGRADAIKDVVSEGVALQVELLGSAIQVWSTMFESMAAYTRTASEELVSLSSRGDANKSIDKLIGIAREKLDRLE
jgi:hypothetical protein